MKEEDLTFAQRRFLEEVKRELNMMVRAAIQPMVDEHIRAAVNVVANKLVAQLQTYEHNYGREIALHVSINGVPQEPAK